MSILTYQDNKIFYEETGSGEPLLMLHGNTASGRLFAPVIPMFTGKYRVITMDFLGCGRSDRVSVWPEDLWYEWGEQAEALCEHLELSKVNLIGTSGGALAAINLALEHPDRVRKLIADSFEGDHSLPMVTDSLAAGREASKKDAGAIKFYEMMNGSDWQKIVDADTQAVLAHAANIGAFFHKQLSELNSDILLTGSHEDEFCPGDFFDALFSGILKKVGHGKIHIFEHGGHPAMLSNLQAFTELCNAFLMDA